METTPNRTACLSPRENEVLQLLARQGHAKAVATELGVSVRTVEAHLANARAKLGVETTLQALTVVLGERRVEAPVSEGTDPVQSAQAIRPRTKSLRLIVASALVVVLVGMVLSARALFISPHNSSPASTQGNAVGGSGVALKQQRQTGALFDLVRDCKSVDEIRKRLVRIRHWDPFTDRFVEAKKEGDLGYSPGTRWPYHWDTQALSPFTQVDVTAFPNDQGPAVRFTDLSQRHTARITRTFGESRSSAFIDWEQYHEGRADCLLFAIDGWIDVASFPSRSLYGDLDAGFAIKGLEGVEPPICPIAPGRWYHIALLLDGSAKRMTVWIDGVPKIVGVLPNGDARPITSLTFQTGGMTQAPKGVWIRNFRWLGLE